MLNHIASLALIFFFRNFSTVAQCDYINHIPNSLQAFTFLLHILKYHSLCFHLFDSSPSTRHVVDLHSSDGWCSEHFLIHILAMYVSSREKSEVLRPVLQWIVTLYMYIYWIEFLVYKFCEYSLLVCRLHLLCCFVKLKVFSSGLPSSLQHCSQ